MEVLDTIIYHYKKRNINWPMVIYLSLAHFTAIIGLLCLPFCKVQTLLWAFLLWPITGLGITCGAHRLWSHRSFKAGLPLRIVLMIANSIANQGSLYHWCRDHRTHHKFSETNADPHDATRGFFFAHMGWLLVKKHPNVIHEGMELDYSDLKADMCIMFQMKLDPWFALFMCFVFPALVSLWWGEQFWIAFCVAGALRYVYVLHCTWLVNSAAHLHGDHPYDAASNPAENPFVALMAIGEGWHNWHHKYPFDYAASEYGITSQYNPTKMFIDVCCWFGLASDAKRATGAWNKLKTSKLVD